MISRYTANNLHPFKEQMSDPFIVESIDEQNMLIDKLNLASLMGDRGGKFFNESTWLLPNGFNLSDHFSELCRKNDWVCMFADNNKGIIRDLQRTIVYQLRKENRLLKVSAHQYYVTAPPRKAFEESLGKLVEGFKKATSVIEWIYDSHGSTVTIPLQPRGLIHSAYPWIKGSVEDYIDAYLDSDSSVMVLIGPPGTGKTSLIKQLISHREMSAYVTYDTKLMDNDSFFASFMESDVNILVMEDADAFLSARTDGNTMMHRFLNMSDGLISTKSKKIIFSTNLSNINEVDAALIRPGRCFDVLHHRALTRDECDLVLEEMNIDRSIPAGDKITLAELLQSQPHETSLNKKTMGFIR